MKASCFRFLRSVPMLALGLLAFLSLSPWAQAISPGDSFGLSPFWTLRTIETEHFRISYPQELEPQAKLAARYYEEAQDQLSKELKWSPLKKVNVLLIDNADAANGMTTPILRFGMILYLTPPDNWFSTAFYDDWLKLLVYHEYAHFLNMDPTLGIYSGFRILLGDVLLPNSLWPSWMLEGLATYMETKYSEQGGRGRSPFYDMVIRTAVLENRFDRGNWVTLNRLDGAFPWAPSGEIPYLFGYFLMNEIARERPGILGEMSLRSAGRVPFFINGNLENLTGRDWYQTWESWVSRARGRAERDLQVLKKAAPTPYQIIDNTRFETFGSALSPDGKLLAYNHETEDHWQTLRVRDLQSGQTRIIEDKVLGVGFGFTPDSQTLVFSSLRRHRNYSFFSDLRVWERASGHAYWLTLGARARDPQISPDGRFIVYTVAENSAVHLQIANLVREKGRLRLEKSRRLYQVASLDRISTPKFSLDGKTIACSLKVNGESGEKLITVEVESGQVIRLLDDRYYHRFPAYDSKGDLYFVSNRTGVDNLYRWDGKQGVQVSHFLTGITMPSFGKDWVYLSVYTSRGWSLASSPADAFKGAYDSSTLTLSPPDAPAPAGPSALNPSIPASRPYSAWDSLAPRQWAPLLLLENEGGYVGGQIAGYDQALEHTYLLMANYNLDSKAADHVVDYRNRSLGVNINLFSARLTQDLVRETRRVVYERDSSAGLNLSFPFQYTFSVLEPSLGAAIERDFQWDRLTDEGPRLLGTSRYVPTQTASVRYSFSRSSRLGILPEKGRVALFGVRRYDDSEIENYKLVGKYSEFLHLGRHFVLTPSLKGMRVSKSNPRFSDANAGLSGDRSQFLNALPGDGFDKLVIRGYPNVLLIQKEAYVGSLDFTFPVAQIFRGWGTNPFFGEQLFLNAFGENAYVPSLPSELKNLASVGTGLYLSSRVLNWIPLNLGVEYQRGLNQRARGQGEFFLSLNVNALPFDF